MNRMNAYHKNKRPLPVIRNYSEGWCGGSDDSDDDPGSTNPVCVGAGDTT